MFWNMVLAACVAFGLVGLLVYLPMRMAGLFD